MVFADNATSQWDVATATAAGIEKGKYGEFGGAEKSATVDNVVYYAQDIMRNNNNKTLGIAADQILLFKKKDGHFINKNSMTLVSLVIIVNDETLFEVATGTAADELTPVTLTAADENVSLTSYDGAVGDEQNFKLRKATIDLTGKNFVKITAANAGTPFLYSAVLTYEDDGSGQKVTHVESVTLDIKEKTLAAYETLQLAATVAPDDADNKEITWASSDEEVATVDENGLVSAWAAGTADIIVKSVDGEKADTCKLTVTAAKKSDFVLIQAANLNDNDTVIITMTVDSVGVPMVLNSEGATSGGPKGIAGGLIDGTIVPATDNVVFIAHVNADGIRFVPKGHEEIDSIYLYVSGAPSNNDGVRVKKIGKGDRWIVDAETGYLKATYTYHPGEENEEVITRYLGVNEGVFKAYKLDSKGKISSKIKDETLKFFVKGAEPIAVTGVTLDKTEETLKVGATLQLVATVAPAEAANPAVIWSSSDDAIATVSETGLVTAVAEGEATITVKTVDGEKTATCKITVILDEAIENIEATESATKLFHNGQLFIIRDGIIYNVQGSRVK